MLASFHIKMKEMLLLWNQEITKYSKLHTLYVWEVKIISGFVLNIVTEAYNYGG